MPWATAEKRAAWSRDYYRRKRAEVLDNKKRWTENNREKRRAEVALNNAVRDGRVSKPDACEECGGAGTRIEAHHDDYSRWLDVYWLCSTCHGKTRSKDQ